MNAPQAIATLKPTITMLALKDLAPSGTHIQALRRQRFDDKLIGELAESIKAVGILQPILARPMNGEGGKALAKLGRPMHEIVAGERRFLAAKKAGMTEIPVSVRELTDDQVLEVQLIENLQREGLHELEEAEGYEELMKLKQISADVVADMVGRSRSYVFKRTKLLALCKEARQAFYGGALDASTALLIARIPGEELQKQAMKDLKEQRQYGDVLNFKDAQKFIHDHFMLQLKAAPFKLDDADLVPAAGPCTTCPKRTGNQKELFADVKSSDTCTDPKCFGEKRKAGETALIAVHKAKGVEVIVGEDAKRVFPYGDRHASNGYHLASEQCWSDSKGRKYSQMVDEKDIKLVVSPHSSQLIKVVHNSALPSAKKKRKAKAASPAKKGPDENAIHSRILAQVHEKFSGELTKPFVAQLLCELTISAENSLFGEGGEVLDVHVQEAWGVKGTRLSNGCYDGKLPKSIESFDAKKLGKLAVELMVLCDLAEGGGRRAGIVLDALKIDRKKIEKDLAAELKAADKAAPAAKAKKKG